MTFNELRKGERWMTEEELRLIRRYVLCMKNFLIAWGVEESPLLCFRVGDLGLQWLIVRRLENGLAQQENCEKTELPLATTALADHIGKGRERLRKAIRELEDTCARLGTPLDTGLADQLAPLMRETRALLHDPAFSPEALDSD